MGLQRSEKLLKGSDGVRDEKAGISARKQQPKLVATEHEEINTVLLK